MTSGKLLVVCTEYLTLIIGQKVRGSQILQQGAFKLAAGKVSQSSYTKILQERFGVVKKFYKQQEGLRDKNKISPFENEEYVIILFKTVNVSIII